MEIVGMEIDWVPEWRLSIPSITAPCQVEHCTLHVLIKERILGAIPNLGPREGGHMWVVQTDSLPKLQIIVAWIPGAQLETVVILTKLERQNPSLKAGLRQV
jgi:hypothetical protein